MKKFAKMAVAAAIAGLSLAAQADLLIDDYSVSQSFIFDKTTNGAGVSSAVNDASILGGQREIFVSKTAQSSTDGALGGSIGVTGGQLLFSSDAVQAAYGIVRYDGTNIDASGTFSGINAIGLGGMNFNLVATGFKLGVFDADLGFPFRLSVYTDATNYTTMDLFSTGPFPSSDIVDFSSFLGGSHVTPEGFVVTSFGTGVDFDSIGALEATINTGGLIPRVDLVLEDVSVVPEPGSLALLGLGLLGLGAMRRRKSVK